MTHSPDSTTAKGRKLSARLSVQPCGGGGEGGGEGGGGAGGGAGGEGGGRLQRGKVTSE